MHSVLVSTLETLHELLRIFFVENDENPSQTALFFGNFPVAFEALRLGQILEQAQFAPIAQLVLVLPEAVRADSLLGQGAFTALAKPILGHTRVVRLIVVRFQGQPAARDLLRVPELGSSLNEELFNVHIFIGQICVIGFTSAHCCSGRLHLFRLFWGKVEKSSHFG